MQSQSLPGPEREYMNLQYSGVKYVPEALSDQTECDTGTRGDLWGLGMESSVPRSAQQTQVQTPGEEGSGHVELNCFLYLDIGWHARVRILVCVGICLA